MTKKIIPVDLKLTMSFYLERFSGPQITNYCLDLFALTPYEFYLFVKSVASNYFLIVSLNKFTKATNFTAKFKINPTCDSSN